MREAASKGGLGSSAPMLPDPPDAFVGRERELRELAGEIATHRLVTVSGLGGIGKSRLAIEVARGLADQFPDGVRYADLSSASSGTGAAGAVADGLGIAVGTGGAGALFDPVRTEASIVEYLRGLEALLVLDNCDLKTESCRELVREILVSCSGVKLLATSRSPMGVADGSTWVLGPMGMPSTIETPEQVLEESDAVRLFVSRASQASTSFELSDKTLRPVVNICSLLDGHPLGIELAAARTAVLDVEALVQVLDSHVGDLGGQAAIGEGGLRGAIEWSYDLANARERQALERLSVFRGGFSIEAATHVVSDDEFPPDDVVRAVEALVSHSLISVSETGGARRYSLLGISRDFAFEKLAKSPKLQAVRGRHAEFFSQLVEDNGDGLLDHRQVLALRLLKQEASNIEEAVGRAIEDDHPTVALAMVGRLRWSWFIRRQSRRGLDLIRRALTADSQPPGELRARASNGGALLALMERDIPGAVEMATEAAKLYRKLQDAVGEAEAHLYLGLVARAAGGDAAAEFKEAQRLFDGASNTWGSAWARWFLATEARSVGDLGGARDLAAVSLGMFQRVGVAFGQASALTLLGALSRAKGDLPEAHSAHARALELYQQVGDRSGETASYGALGIDAREAGELREAVEHFEQAVAAAADLGEVMPKVQASVLLGDAYRLIDRLEEARDRLRECLILLRGVDDRGAEYTAILALESLALAEARIGQWESAARLLGATERLRESHPPISTSRAAQREEAAINLRARLGAETIEVFWEEGRRLPLLEAISIALAEPAETEEQPVESLTIEQLELGERVTSHLSTVGERRQMRVGGIRISGRRRRPTGEKAPLPRQLRASGWIWLVLAILTVFAFPLSRDWWEARDNALINDIAGVRQPWLTSVAQALHALGSLWLIRPLRWSILLVLVIYKRWRHLFAVIMAILVTETLVSWIAVEIGRPRPFADALAPWSGYSHPSGPVASLSVTVAVASLALIPVGRHRHVVSAALAAVVGLLVGARVYLGVDHLTDGVVGGLFGAAVAVLVFKWLAPDAVFPVTYRRGVTAHLDIGGARGEAIRRAAADQLGLDVVDIELFGTESSGGSTPLRILVAGDPELYLFGKLYSTTHLRSDRWYKIGRTILYGSLEDEIRFQSVRRLVEYEDYMVLLLHNAGVPSAKPQGIAEITPEREYLIVTEFLQDASEIGSVDIDDAIIDDALLIIRKLWDAGLSHRDIKPANVMVQDGRVRLIDVAFSMVRPSPWRQAVDLANMLIILGLRVEPERVYKRALRYFSPEDIAEAFASTKSITIPGQSRQELKQRLRDDGLEVVGKFRELAPDREPISIQRWSGRRIAVTIGALVVVSLFVQLFVANLTGRGFL